MSEQQLPPTIDPTAAQRWHARAVDASPWLHEEIARRMQDRLQWMTSKPANWCDWDPLNGGIEGHALVQQQFAQAVAKALKLPEVRARILATGYPVVDDDTPAAFTAMVKKDMPQWKAMIDQAGVEPN